MKTPDEIKKGLETCIGKCTGNKPHCPYHECGDGCMDTMNRNALAYIQQLEEKYKHAMENAKILSDAVTRLERERDALMCDLTTLACECIPSCSMCKHYTVDTEVCVHTVEIGAEDIGDCFEWRGVQEGESDGR